MKNRILLTIIAAIVAVGISHAQTESINNYSGGVGSVSFKEPAFNTAKKAHDVKTLTSNNTNLKKRNSCP